MRLRCPRHPSSLRKLATVVVALSFVVSLAAQATATVAQKPELHGHTRVVDGLDVLFLSGTEEQQAFTEGYLFAPRIKELFADFALHNPFVPKPIAWDLAILPQIKKSVEVPARVTAFCEAILRGMVARDPDSIDVAELHRELNVNDLIGVAALPDFVGLMCSSFAIYGDATALGHTIVGRNLDYPATPKLLEHVIVVVRTGREGRADTVTLGWPGLPGVVTGLSAHGVFTAIHDVPAKKIGRERCCPRTVALLELLETFTPAKDPAHAAGDFLRQSRYGMGGNVMFAWGSGKDVAPGAAVIEIGPDDLTEDGVTVRMPAEGQTFITCSNHFRLRDEPSQCWRFSALFDGVAKRTAAIDLDAARELIKKSQVGMTLHQVCADLDAGQVVFRVRRSSDGTRNGGEWTETKVWSLSELFAEARRQH